MGAEGLALLTIALGSAIAYFGVGPDWAAWRVGAVLVLGGVVVASAPVADSLRSWATKGADLGGDLVGQASRELGAAVADFVIPAIVIVVGILWVAAMLPARLTKWGGRILSREMNQTMLLAGAVAIGILGSFAGGAVGDLFGWIRGTAAELGMGAARWVGVA